MVAWWAPCRGSAVSRRTKAHGLWAELIYRDKPHCAVACRGLRRAVLGPVPRSNGRDISQRLQGTGVACGWDHMGAAEIRFLRSQETVS